MRRKNQGALRHVPLCSSGTANLNILEHFRVHVHARQTNSNGCVGLDPESQSSEGTFKMFDISITHPWRDEICLYSLFPIRRANVSVAVSGILPMISSPLLRFEWDASGSL